MMKDYIEAASTTNAGNFHGQMVGYFYFMKAAKEFIAAGNKLDEIKKTLFYGRRLGAIEPHFDWGGYNMGRVTVDHQIIHGILGCATESVEMVEALVDGLEKISLGEISEIDKVNLCEECGDIMWYLAVLFRSLETDFTTEAKRNIAKLMLRYPDGFTEENALVRDIAAERRLLETDVGAL